MSKEWTPEEAAAELERLERIDAKVRKHRLEHAFTAASEEAELVIEGYGGVAGDEIYVELRVDSYVLTKEEVEELHAYLGRWLEARNEPSPD